MAGWRGSEAQLRVAWRCRVLRRLVRWPCTESWPVWMLSRRREPLSRSWLGLCTKLMRDGRRATRRRRRWRRRRRRTAGRGNQEKERQNKEEENKMRSGLGKNEEWG